MRIAHIVLLTAALLLPGCKRGFVILPAQADGKVTFRLEPKVGDDQGVEIVNFEVYRVKSPESRREMVWWIKTGSGKPEKVHAVTYGVVPEGFKEAKAAQPLAEGQSYEVKSGMPGITGYTEFRYHR